MVGQAQILITECIDVGRFFYTATAATVLQHALYDGIGPFAMEDYFFFVIGYIFSEGLHFIKISLLNFLIQFDQQFFVHFGKIVHEVQGVLYFMGYAGSKLTQGGHLF